MDLEPLYADCPIDSVELDSTEITAQVYVYVQSNQQYERDNETAARNNFERLALGNYVAEENRKEAYQSEQHLLSDDVQPGTLVLERK